MVEKALGFTKSIMKRAREDRRNYLVALMEYRNTPISGLDLSPAQMMFNRRLKTKLTISNKLLNAELFNNIREKLIKRQNVQKIQYDKTAHPLPELEPEDNSPRKAYGCKIPPYPPPHSEPTGNVLLRSLPCPCFYKKFIKDESGFAAETMRNLKATKDERDVLLSKLRSMPVCTNSVCPDHSTLELKINENSKINVNNNDSLHP
ncbi:transposon Tf2-6 polyprotein [Trichonephila clavipes]|uniref:Transposon Tf2-6 polyprotein n=1 Tax=Trichonephila clavipes TaxID=2585209 RepID=A0A8X6RUU2_TRICX|nr:transposon Tf2-6 polyprotein [Trichonephila clavipes]